MIQRVGIIGLGLLGSALAERLLRAGYEVAGYDVNPAQNEALAMLGGQPLANAAAVAGSCGTILLSLPTSDIAAAVVNEIELHLAGKTVLDTTTGDPEVMAALGKRLAGSGCDYLDATIAGSSTQVRRGEAVVMLGGPEAAVQKCRSLLSSLAKKCFHLGACGSGARLKLVVNLVLGLNRAVLAEGLSFAKAMGIEPAQALEVLLAGPAFSRVMETKGAKMLSGDFVPEARLAQHHKDVKLILAEAARADIELPLSQRHEELLAGLVASGDGDLDNSAVIRTYDNQA